MEILKNKLVMMGIIVLAVLIGVSAFMNWPQNNEGPTSSFEVEKKSGPCPGRTEVLKTSDGKKYNILHNFYHYCPV